MGELDHLISALRLRADGSQALANSHDVAEFFERRHADVVRQIDQLRANPEVDRSWFRVPPDRHRGRSFDMTRDGFAILATSWTGETGRAFNNSYMRCSTMAALTRARITPCVL